MKRTTLYIILGIAIAIVMGSFLTIPYIMRNHYYSQATEQDSCQNKEKALELYKRAAEWDHAEGAYKAGEILFNPNSVERDSTKIKEAIKLFEKSSRLGYKEANYMLGTALFALGSDTTQVFPPLRKDCGSKDANAKFSLGCFYCQYDMKEGIRYVEIAAKTLPSANFCLYSIYSDSNNNLFNMEKANQYLMHGAELGDPQLQVILGHNYLNGTNGFNRDSEKGFKLLLASVKNGATNAYTSLGWCYLNSVGTAQNFDEAIRWIKKGEEAGDVNAKYLLGICYGYGYGVIKDERHGIQLIQEAAKNGCADAKTYVAQFKRITRPIVVSRPQQRYQGQREVRCRVCGGSGYRHGVNMGLPVLGRDSWGHDICRCDYCAGRGYTME